MPLTKVTGGEIDGASSINVTGIVTATSFSGDVSGNINSSGVSTFSTLRVGTGVTISSGVVTATSFVGNLTGNVTGNVTGNATGLSGTPSISVDSITAATATFTGNVSVAGTVTYEDVTNIDSIGIVTARGGLQVGTGGTVITTTTGGSVGIGLTNPQNALHIGGGGNIRLNRADNQRSSLIFHDNSGFNINANSSGDDVIINAGNVSGRIILQNNSLTTLTVQDRTLLVGTATSSGTADQKLQVNGGALINTSSTTTAGLGIGATNPSARVHINASLNNSVGGLFIDSKTRDGGETNVPLLRIDSGGAGGNQVGALWFNTSGALGIGTTSITTNVKLSVLGGATNATTVIANTSSFTGGTNFTTPHLVVANSNDVTGNVTRLALVVGNGGQSYIESLMENSVTSYASMIFRTRGSEPGVGERMRITSAGNIGIGTTNPTTKLDVFVTGGEGLPSVVTGERMRVISNDVVSRSGYLSIIAGSSAYSGVFFGDKDAADIGKIRYYHADNSLQFLVNGTTEAIRVTSAGNVGIGTDTNIVDRLLVVDAMAKQSSSSGWGIVVSDANTDGAAGRGGAIAFGARRTDGGNFNAAAVSGAKSNSTGMNENGDLVFWSSVNSTLTERMRIVTGGNVGIGTANPVAALHVRGSSSSVATQDSPLYLDVPHNTISMFVGRQVSTSGFDSNTYTGTIRFNGSNVAWGDISYYPNGDSGTGSFRFTRNGSTVSSTPNARIGVGGIWMPGPGKITLNNGDVDIEGQSSYHLRIRTYDGSSQMRQLMKFQGGTSGGHVTIGGDALGPSNGYVPLHFASSKTSSLSYPHGGSTIFIGQISPGNSGNTYLHVKFDVPSGAMFYLRSWGYVYGQSQVYNSWCVGYLYNNSVISSQTYNSNGSYGITNVYYTGDDNVALRLTLNQSTGNAWGYSAFEGGYDGITGNLLDDAIKILAYTWTSSSANQY